MFAPKLKSEHIELANELGLITDSRIRLDSRAANALGGLRKEGVSYAQSLYSANDAGGGRLDAAESIMAARDIESVHAKAYQKKYPELKAYNGDILPIFTDVDEGVDNYKFEIHDGTGSCQWLDMNSDGKNGLNAAIFSTEVEGKIHWYHTTHHWTVQQLRRVAQKRVTINLPTTLLNLQRRASAQKVNKTWLFGDKGRGLLGMTTNPFVQQMKASKTGTNRYLVNKTTAEIVADFRSLIHSVSEQTNGAHKVTKCGMSQNIWNLLHTRSISSFAGGDGTMTVMDFLKSAFPGVEFMIVEEFAASHSFDGQDVPEQTFQDDILVAWDGSLAADELGFVRPRDFTPGDMQQDGLKFNVVSTGVIGGIRMVYPLTIAVMQGVGRS